MLQLREHTRRARAHRPRVPHLRMPTRRARGHCMRASATLSSRATGEGPAFAVIPAKAGTRLRLLHRRPEAANPSRPGSPLEGERARRPPAQERREARPPPRQILRWERRESRQEPTQPHRQPAPPVIPSQRRGTYFAPSSRRRPGPGFAPPTRSFAPPTRTRAPFWGTAAPQSANVAAFTRSDAAFFAIAIVEKGQRRPSNGQRCRFFRHACPSEAQRCPFRPHVCPILVQRCRSEGQRRPSNRQRCPSNRHRCRFFRHR